MDEAELRAIRKPFDEIIARSIAQQAELDKKLAAANQKRETLDKDLSLFLAAWQSDKLSSDEKAMAQFGYLMTLQNLSLQVEEIAQLSEQYRQNVKANTEEAMQVSAQITDAMIAANKKAIQEFDLADLVSEESKN
jgi:hypothetical protein